MDLSHTKAQARAAWHAARAIACNRLGRVTYPSFAHIYVTWRCNLRCHTCNIWREDLYPEMSTEQYVSVLEKLPFLDIVKLTGGEPFLRDDMPTLVRTIFKVANPAMVHIVSNGTVPHRMVELVEQVGNPRLHIRVSLEGKGETHSKLRGRTWAFEKTWAAIEALAPLRKRHGFHLGINYNLCEETLDDLPQVLEHCKAHNIDLVPGLAVFPFLEDKFAEVKDKVALSDPEAFIKRYGEILNMKAGLGPWSSAAARRQSMRAVEELVRGQQDLRFGCRELRNLMFLLPNGNLVTCGLKHKPIGSLLQRSFDELWFGKEIEPYRAAVDTCSGCLQTSIKMASRFYNGQI